MGKFKLSFRRALLSACSILFLMQGCANRPANISTSDPQMPNRKDAVNYLDQPPETTLEVEPSAFWTRMYDRGDPLPNVMVGPLSIQDRPMSEVLSAIAKRVNIGYIPDKNLDSQIISVQDPNRRSLREFLDILVHQGPGFFYEFRNGMLSVESTKKFIVSLPRMQGSMLTISEGFRNLGAQEVFVDTISGNLTMTANYQTYRMCQQFLRDFEQHRDMIYYDVWVFERDLQRGEGIGVFWNSLSAKIGNYQIGAPALSSSSSGASTTGSSIGPAAATGFQAGIIAGDSVISNLLLEAMSEDSEVKTVARPNIYMQSGGTAEAKIGEKQQYIGNVSDTVNSGLNNSTTQGVDPSTLETGIVMRVGGAYSNNIINTTLDLQIENLIAFQVFSTRADGTATTTTNTGTSVATGTNNSSNNSSSLLSSAINAITGSSTNDSDTNNNNGTTLRLPYTSERSLKTVIDARPGDTIVLGGLISTSSTKQDRRIYQTTVPFQDQNNQERKETIIIMRPRVVHIRAKGTPPIAADEVRIPVGVGRNMRTDSGPLIMPRDPQAPERAMHDLSNPARPLAPQSSDAFDLESPLSTNTYPRAQPVLPSNNFEQPLAVTPPSQAVPPLATTSSAPNTGLTPPPTLPAPPSPPAPLNDSAHMGLSSGSSMGLGSGSAPGLPASTQHLSTPATHALPAAPPASPAEAPTRRGGF